MQLLTRNMGAAQKIRIEYLSNQKISRLVVFFLPFLGMISLIFTQIFFIGLETILTEFVYFAWNVHFVP